MTHLVHTLHAPPVERFGAGYTHDGKAVILLGDPIFEADTREECVAWQAKQMEGRRGE